MFICETTPAGCPPSTPLLDSLHSCAAAEPSTLAQLACAALRCSDWSQTRRFRLEVHPGLPRGARTLPQSHPSSPIVLAGPSQISTAPRWLPTAKYMWPGAEALGAPVPRHQFLAGLLHQRVHPCRGRPSDAIPHDTRDRNEEASFHRLASYGNPRFGALEHACGQRKSRALGPLQRGAPPGQDIGSAEGAEQASSDVDGSTPGDECRCAVSGMLLPQRCTP